MARALAITGLTAQSRVYDTSTTATLAGTAGINAVAGDTTFRIARDSTGAPAVPDGLTALSAIYTITPHVAYLRTALTDCCHIALDARGRVVACERRPDGRVPDGCCK